MELQTTGNQSIANRDTVAKFVHDVADMEVRYFTLAESARISKEKVQKEMEQATQRFKQAEVNLHKNLNSLQEAHDAVKEIETYGKWRNKTKSTGRFWGEFFTFIFVYGIFAPILSVLLSSLLGMLIFGTPFEDCNGTFIMPLLFLFLFLYFRICKAIRNSDYVEELKGRKSTVTHWEGKYKQAQEQMELAEIEYNKVQKTEPIALKKAEELEKDAASVKKSIQMCYELGIIKPAYQNLVSVVILDEVFENDKADTMREAMLLCDTELRHSELIGKLDKVIDALQTLATTLQHMNSVLDNINTNVSMISQDVYKMSQSQDRIAYATESIKQSADNTDFYIAQRRAGSI